MSEKNILDPQAIETLRALSPDGGSDFVREIAAIFLEDTPQRIAELDQSMQAQDVTRFVRAAHSIKGSAANMGASDLRSIAERLELSVKGTGLPASPELVTGLKSEYRRTEEAVRELLQN